MSKSKVWGSLVLIIYLLFVIFQINDEFNISFLLDSIIVPLITLGYIMFAKERNLYFLLFLICYSVSDILGVTTHYILYYNLPYNESFIFYEYDYYIGSFLYILAYIFLLFKVCKTINLTHVLKNFKIHLVVLALLNVYLVYVLQYIVKSEVEYKYEYIMEFSYNVIMLVLLSSALLSYFYRDNKKTLLLFFGALFIVFSEVMDIAYNYIDQRALLNVMASTFALCAFFFFYKQSQSKHEINHERDHFALVDEY